MKNTKTNLLKKRSFFAVITIMAIGLIVLPLIGCPEDNGSSSSSSSRSGISITLSQDTLEMKKGDDPVKLTITVNNTDNKAVTWAFDGGSNIVEVEEVEVEDTEDPVIVALNIKAKKFGTTKIIVTSVADEKVKATCTVTVLSFSISLDKSSLDLFVGGEPETLTSTVKNIEGNIEEDETVTWKSSDNSIASVDDDGVVTAKKVGRATITATISISDGESDDEETAECKVVVCANYISNQDNTDGIGIEMVQIPAGKFMMGLPANENGFNGEGPQHEVTLTKSFYIGKYEVTQAEYRTVTTGSPSNHDTSVDDEDDTPDLLPVEQVSWYDAVVFCNRLSILENLPPVYSVNNETDPDSWNLYFMGEDDKLHIDKNKKIEIDRNKTGYRLPTEAEWEYACRAGTTTLYSTGKTYPKNAQNYVIEDEVVPDIINYFYFEKNSEKNGEKMTHKVGQKLPNAWGLYDMNGNVFEWCWDWFADHSANAAAVSDPFGPEVGTSRVARGGSFESNYARMRSTYRNSMDPTGRGLSVGFRLVRSIEEN
jgi:formylglycine-generating enzyme required for sulfatase activity